MKFMSDYKMIEFSPKRAQRFADEHNKAIKEKKEIFMFDGNEFVTAYAHYVLEYLAMNKVIVGKFDAQKLFIYE